MTITTIATGLCALAGFPASALMLVASERPGRPFDNASLDFGTMTRIAVDEPLAHFRARDGQLLGFRMFRAADRSAPLVVIVHGSGWHGQAYQTLARHLCGGGFNVAVPDLRGHGPAPLRRGDVDYIGQLEDDLDDFIEHLRVPGQMVVLTGHSSGGGLVIRYCGAKHRSKVDAAILMSPFLKYDAPTMRRRSGGWARPLTRRIIGLSMLNALGFTALNGSVVLEFNFPRTVLAGPLGATATTAYSHRLYVSYAPRSSFGRDISALPDFLVVAGVEDEAFLAREFEPTMKRHSDKGEYALLDGIGHLDMIVSERTAGVCLRFLHERLGMADKKPR